LDNIFVERLWRSLKYEEVYLEYSRNLVFRVGGHLDQVFQALIDRSRAPLDLKTIKTILGCRHRPRYRPRAKRSAKWQVTAERPAYDRSSSRTAAS
jgi:hypothetical protein